MARKLLGFLVLLGALGVLAGQPGRTRAENKPEDNVYDYPPYCEPGYEVVEEIRYKQVPCERHCCPEQTTKKITKTIYDVKCVDFCQKKCPHCGYENKCCSDCDGGNPDCVKCGKVRTKKILLKKTVTVAECPTTKCAVHVDSYDQVPYKVYRKVKVCGAPSGAPGEMVPPPGVQPEPLPPPGKQPEKLAPPKEEKLAPPKVEK